MHGETQEVNIPLNVAVRLDLTSYFDVSIFLDA
jgi:hypothetical protein